MFTMNRSRLDMKTPAHTITVTAHFRCIMRRTVANRVASCNSKAYTRYGMLGNTYENQACSIAGALEVVGERWSLLIVREVFLGVRRFDEMQADLGIARNVLDARLKRLLDQGVLEKRRYQERPPRYEYLLTERGLDLWPTLVALMQWGDRHAAPDAGPPVLLEHKDCGGAVDEHRTCRECGQKLSASDVRARPGPGARPDHPLLRRANAA
jgi:DNA-binding HxlR family transcriptional regulator